MQKERRCGLLQISVRSVVSTAALLLPALLIVSPLVVGSLGGPVALIASSQERRPHQWQQQK
jgi:hypothetical protein